ncbi:hypothetical protein EDB83DRAFT_2420866 [Lactarius deliciosus]|nr:hypothetical protein EDB83DRAFT_2420866 [Lactarius deliciosus]
MQFCSRCRYSVLQRVIYLYRALGYAALLWAKYYSPRPHSTCSTRRLALVIPQYKVLCVRGNTALAVVVEKVLNPNTTGRMTPKALLNVGMAGGSGTSGGYIGGNNLFKICVGLGSSGLMMPMKEGWLCFGRPMFKDATPTLCLSSRSWSFLVYVPPDKYKTLILESVVKLFANPDRATRMAPPDVLSFR